MDLSFTTYDFQKNGEQITGYSISEINKDLLNTNIYIYRERERNGIVRIIFKYYY